MQSGTSTLNGQVPTTGLSVTEAAQVLGISPNTVRARIKAGRLRAQRVQRPQGDVIGVFLGSEDLPTSGTSAGTSHQVPTGTYNASNHAPAIASQREALALALVPLVEAAVAPLGTELAEVRALLSARDQELGHLRAQFEALQDDRLEIALGRDSEGIAVEPTQIPSEARNGRPWWRFWVTRSYRQRRK